MYRRSPDEIKKCVELYQLVGAGNKVYPTLSLDDNLLIAKFRQECRAQKTVNDNIDLENADSLASMIVISNGYGDYIMLHPTNNDLTIAARLYRSCNMVHHSMACQLAIVYG